MILLNNINENIKKSLNSLLKDSQRFDITIDSILDDEYKKCSNIRIFIYDLVSPSIFEIIQGTFIIFASNAASNISVELIKSGYP